MVTPLWLATAAIEVFGIVLVALAHTGLHLILGFTTVTNQILFGDVFIAAGTALAMIGGHVTSPWALGLVPTVVMLILFASAFGWFGPGVTF